MNDTDLIQRNQVAIMSGIAALSDRSGEPGTRILADNLDRFATETADHIAKKLYDAAHATETNAWPNDLGKPAYDSEPTQ